MHEYLTMSVREMARLIKDGELSPAELLDVHLERMEEVNPKINAVVVPRFEEARKEAKAAEEKLAGGGKDLPPLFGVPCTVKDTYALKGHTWSGGVWARKDLIADFDATAVARLKKAGAIIMGKTNVPEAAMWAESYNSVYGWSKNPYDLRRGVGGSSGGEGAIVASAASPFGIGSDIGGSIRYPSAFNGVAGHKPTGGLVPGTGHFPAIKGELMRYCAYGPLCRNVGDAAYVLPILAGPDGTDPITEDKPVKSPDDVDLSKVRVFFYDDNGQTPCGAEVRRAVSMAAGALKSETASADYWVPPNSQFSLNIWSAGLSQSPEPFIDNLRGDEPMSAFTELLKFMAGQSKVTWPALGAALIEPPQKLLGPLNRRLLRMAGETREALDKKLGDDGVIVCPVFPVPSPKHYHIWWNIFGVGYSGLYNIMHFPATIMPILRRPSGLPVSIQVVATKWNDHLAMAVARKLEETFGGWVPPETVD